MGVIRGRMGRMGGLWRWRRPCVDEGGIVDCIFVSGSLAV